MVLPKCTNPRHTEFNCLGAYYQNKRRFPRSNWCETCLAFFCNVDEEE